MNKFKQEQFEKSLTDNMIITGGHYMVMSDGSANMNQGTIDSFEAALKMYSLAKKKGKKVGLGVLINNMGGVCDAKEKVCNIKSDEVIENHVPPPEYIDLMDLYEIPHEELNIYWEKHMRNRGKKELLKKIKAKADYIKLKSDAYWFINPVDGRRITLSRPNPNDKYGIAACPLIMSAYAYQHKQDGFTSSLNFYYVDSENEINIPNYFAIEKGRVVAKYFYDNLNIINVYMLKDQVVTSFDMQSV